MKVFFCLHHFLPDVVAGTEMYVYSLAKGVQERGIEIAVLIPGFGEERNSEYLYDGIRVIRFAENSAEGRQMILGNVAPEGLKNFMEILAVEKPGIVHFHELIAGRGTSIYHVKAAYEAGFKIMLTAHLSYYSCQTGTLMYQSRVKCDGEIQVSKCTRCVYSSKGIGGARYQVLTAGSSLLYAAGINSLKWDASIGTALGIPFLIAKKKNDLHLLASMCNKIVSLTDFYTSILHLNDVPENKIATIKQALPGDNLYKKSIRPIKLPIRLIFIGRITEIKGLKLLLEALQQLPAGQFILDVYGAYGEEEYVKSCKDISVKMSGIEWKGFIGAEEKYNKLTHYDLLILPSFSEMSPLVIQEAFAACIPVLASDVYGNTEQIRDGLNGWLFKCRDVNDLVIKLQNIANNPGMIDTAKKHIPAVRSFKEVTDSYISLYESVLVEQKEIS